MGVGVRVGVGVRAGVRAGVGVRTKSRRGLRDNGEQGGGGERDEPPG